MSTSCDDQQNGLEIGQERLKEVGVGQEGASVTSPKSKELVEIRNVSADRSPSAAHSSRKTPDSLQEPPDDIVGEPDATTLVSSSPQMVDGAG